MSIIVFILDDDCFWGITPENEIMFKNSSSQPTWQQVTGTLTHISVSQLGVFGVDPNENIYYRVGTNNNPSSIGTSWQSLVLPLIT